MIEISLRDRTGKRLGDASHPVQQLLSGLHAATKDLRPALQDLGETLLRSTLVRFDRERDPEGNPWKPLSAEHLDYKKDKGYSLKILTMRGHLRGSILWKVTGQTLVLGTNRVYAGVHQFGGQVQFKGRKGTLRLRTDRKGNLLRQNQLGMGPHQRGTGNLAVFARPGHKRVVERQFQIGPYTIEVPGRPFLGMSVEDQADAIDILRQHLLDALNKPS